jgi:hypothetical protein
VESLLKLTLLAIFVVLLIIAISLSILRRRRLDQAYPPQNLSEPLYEFEVRAKKRAWGGYGYVALKSPTGVRLNVYSDLVVVDLAGAMEGRLMGTRLALETAELRMTMGRAAFPVRFRECILLSGMELGKSIGLAVYSDGQLSEIWDALAQVGVQPMLN